ncbi:MAG: threonylcarbamoyl-AMP synthase [Bacteroidales bacterium]|jgi:L-threonylcarbamoyladenylate synthase|nr:threonylcarbamoyl-AMP synthase [Bacteroidales bacterium]
MSNIAEEVKRSIEIMRKGGIILYPTDTVWGIGCDATNEEAVKKVYELKKRSESKSLILLVDSPDRIVRYVKEVPNVAYDMMTLSTTPLTVILDDARNLAQNLIAEDGSIAFRVTSEAFSKELCFRFQKPIVSTSANISGEPTAATFAEISDEIKNGVDYVVDFKQNDNTPHKPSSIVKLKNNGEITIIRK